MDDDMNERLDAMLDAAFAPLKEMLAGTPEAQPQEEPAPEPEPEQPSVPESYDIAQVLAAYERGELDDKHVQFVAEQEQAKRAAEQRPATFAALREVEQRAATEAAMAELSEADRKAIMSADASLASLRGR